MSEHRREENGGEPVDSSISNDTMAPNDGMVQSPDPTVPCAPSTTAATNITGSVQDRSAQSQTQGQPIMSNLEARIHRFKRELEVIRNGQAEIQLAMPITGEQCKDAVRNYPEEEWVMDRLGNMYIRELTELHEKEISLMTRIHELEFELRESASSGLITLSEHYV